MDIAAVQVFEGKKPGSSIFHVGDGRYYRGNIRRNGNLYLKCNRYDALHCPGTAVIRRRARVFEHLTPHIRRCQPDIFYADEMLLRRNIKRRCRDLECASYKKILTEERRRFPIEVRSRVSLAKMRTAMRNARLSSFPQPAPRTLQELTDLFQDPRYEVLTATIDGNDNLYAGSVTDVNGHHHILFCSERQRTLIASATWLHGDGTLKVVPALEGVSQVFAIVTTWNYHIIPLAWALMESKTEVAYEAVLTLLKNQLGPNVREDKKVMTDFERGQQNAWETVFPDCDLRGCLFHLVRAFVLEALIMHLRHHLVNTPEVRRIFELYCALPLLPLEHIRSGYLLVLQESRNEGRAIFRICRPFSAYVLRHWMSDENRLRWMCVHGSTHRTNNASESHNSTLKDTVTVHPNIYLFLNALTKVEDDMCTDIRGLRRGETVGRARKTTAVANDLALRRLEATLENPPGNMQDAILDFLEAARHRLQHIIEDALHELRPHRPQH